MTLLERPSIGSGSTDVDARPSPRAAPATAQARRAAAAASFFNLVGAALAGVSIALLLHAAHRPVRSARASSSWPTWSSWSIYGVLVSLNDDGPAVRDAVMTVLMASTAVLAFGALALVVVFTLAAGGTRSCTSTSTRRTSRRRAPWPPLTMGGMAHALVGTLWMVGIAVVLTVPIGLVAAVYLDMTRSRPAELFRTVVEAMTALPSILAGLFIYASWIIAFGFQRSRAGRRAGPQRDDAALHHPGVRPGPPAGARQPPGGVRGRSGAPAWRSEWQVVLPTARSGLATAVILGVARAIGEASPVLLTAGFTTYINANPLHGRHGLAAARDAEAGPAPASPATSPGPSAAARSCCW